MKKYNVLDFTIEVWIELLSIMKFMLFLSRYFPRKIL